MGVRVLALKLKDNILSPSLALIKVSGQSPSTGLTHDITSCVIGRVLRRLQSPVWDNGARYLVCVCCKLTHNSIPASFRRPSLHRRLARLAAVRRGRAGSDKRLKVEESPKPVYLLKEDSPYDCYSETSWSLGHLWRVLSQPPMWHWAVYDFLMILHHFVCRTYCSTTLNGHSFRINLRKGESGFRMGLA